jgi:hypothetical protein
MMISVDNAIAGVVEHFFDDYKSTNPKLNEDMSVTVDALHFMVQVSAGDYEAKVDMPRQYIHFIVGRHIVWVCDSDSFNSYNPSMIPLEDWENTSNHDACWKYDGIESPLNGAYFGIAKWINNERTARNFPEIAPKDVHMFVSFGLGEMFRKLRITHKSQPDQYHRKLLKVEVV